MHRMRIHFVCGKSFWMLKVKKVVSVSSPPEVSWCLPLQVSAFRLDYNLFCLPRGSHRAAQKVKKGINWNLKTLLAVLLCHTDEGIIPLWTPCLLIYSCRCVPGTNIHA